MTFAGILITAFSGHIADKVGVYPFFKWSASFAVVNVLINYTVISLTSSIAVISVCQIALALNTFGGISGVYWV